MADVELDRNSKVLVTFGLSGKDILNQPKDISADVVDVIIKPVPVRPTKDDDGWLPMAWNLTDPTKLNVPINLEHGFDITMWTPGTYWWFARPHDDPELPIL